MYTMSVSSIDRIDARTLAQLLASGFLPAVWQPDHATAVLRRQVSRRVGQARRTMWRICPSVRTSSVSLRLTWLLGIPWLWLGSLVIGNR
jgi:hypothetical protein